MHAYRRSVFSSFSPRAVQQYLNALGNLVSPEPNDKQHNSLKVTQFTEECPGADNSEANSKSPNEAA